MNHQNLGILFSDTPKWINTRHLSAETSGTKQPRSGFIYDHLDDVSIPQVKQTRTSKISKALFQDETCGFLTLEKLQETGTFMFMALDSRGDERRGGWLLGTGGFS